MDGTPKIREKGKSSPLPYALLMFGATRRLSGVSYRDFSTKPEATANSYLAAYEKFGGLLNVWIDLSVEASDFGQKMVYPKTQPPILITRIQ